MPELPDIVVYTEALAERISGATLQGVRINSPFFLRTAAPPISDAAGKEAARVVRIGKRIAICLENDLTLVLHLMIAGRLHWRAPGAKLAGKNALAAFDFPSGTLLVTEAGSKRRASLHLVSGKQALSEIDPRGLEVLDSSLDQFLEVLRSENHTLKRALTDPALFSGIGNAYSDEILFEARLSPAALTSRMTDSDIARLFESAVRVLNLWTQRLRNERAGQFPENVTAFRPEMAVHGKFGQPCPRCGAEVQRIRYADNETNYCARCQTADRLLSDRAFARLLGQDWPRTLDALEAQKKRRAAQREDNSL